MTISISSEQTFQAQFSLRLSSSGPAVVQRGQSQQAGSANGTDTTQGVQKPGDSVRLSIDVQVRSYSNQLIMRAQRDAGLAIPGADPSQTDLTQELADLATANPTLVTKDDSGQSAADKLAADFAPDKVANRIVGFSTSYYDQWRTQHKLTDGQDARQQFADYIGKAVDSGIGDAKRMLGNVASSISDNIKSTQDQVHSLLDDFVKNGQTKTPEELAQAHSYGLSFNASFQAQSGDRGSFMKEMAARLNPDGTLRLDSPNASVGSTLSVTG